jgi:hypothetical protein
MKTTFYFKNKEQSNRFSDIAYSFDLRRVSRIGPRKAKGPSALVRAIADGKVKCSLVDVEQKGPKTSQPHYYSQVNRKKLIAAINCLDILVDSQINESATVRYSQVFSEQDSFGRDVSVTISRRGNYEEYEVISGVSGNVFLEAHKAICDVANEICESKTNEAKR